MAIKKVLLSKKVNNVVYEIFPKTSADVVVYGESTVAAALAQFAQDLTNVYTKADVYTKGETYAKGEVDAAIEAESLALYNKIMGITEEDGATVKEAYDTLKEVAAWIDAHGEVAAAFTTDIAALKAAVGDENSGLVKGLADAVAAIESNDSDIEALQTAVGNLETALGQATERITAAEGKITALEGRMDTAESDIDALEGRATAVEGRMDTAEDDIDAVEGRATTLEGRADAIEGRLDTAEGNIDDHAGQLEELTTKVNSLIEVGGTKVEKSETNGNIKVDGVEVNVYTHPETHSAEMITETEERKFVTADEKAAIASAAEILLVSSQDDVTDETNLYLVEIAE